MDLQGAIGTVQVARVVGVDQKAGLGGGDTWMNAFQHH